MILIAWRGLGSTVSIVVWILDSNNRSMDRKEALAKGSAKRHEQHGADFAAQA